MKGEYNFNSPAWKTVSKNAKNFISRLILLDPTKRMAADQALNHIWLKDGGKKEQTKLDSKILESLRDFRNVNALKREAMRIIVSFCSEAEIKNLKLFKKFIY
jgi:calcium-dependent protein kinase